MKQIIALVAMLTLSLAVNAQTVQKQMELSISYGINPFQQTMQATLLVDGDPYYTKVTSATGTPFVTLRYYVSKKVALGFTAGIQQFNTTYYGSINSSGDYKSSYLYKTVASEVLINYMNKPTVRLYTYFGAGCSFYTVQSSSLIGYRAETTGRYTSFNMQYVPFGVNFGTHKLSGFAEIGIGYKGFANVGMSYRLAAPN